MGPLALMAKEAGIEVCGSDLHEGAVSGELRQARIPFVTDDDEEYLKERASAGNKASEAKVSEISEGGVGILKAGASGAGAKSVAQDGEYLRKWIKDVDWFVYTSALPEDHPELVLAKKAGVRISKRDELIAYLVEKLGLKMVAVAGTHGKTTTTAMIIWAATQLGMPVSYLVGTTLPFAESGTYDAGSEFLVYEADEYDRNFLRFSPWLAVIPTATYDHPDIYPTVEDYQAAFKKFRGQSEEVIEGSDVSNNGFEFSKSGIAKSGSGLEVSRSGLDLSNSEFQLAGAARRIDAELACQAILRMAEETDFQGADGPLQRAEAVEILNEFPGAGRRFERIRDGVYSDYGHHPEEIVATVEIAKEEAELRGLKGVVLVYEPHQNTRQHEVKTGYRNAFTGVAHLYWVPTYLTREDPKLAVISPEEFIAGLEPLAKAVAEPAELDEKLAENLREWRERGYLVLLMTAGPADGWFRKIWR